jgi:phosphoenolpyruvate phosphomutase
VLRFAAEWSDAVPLIVIPTAMQELSMEVVGQAGISAAVFANQAFRAALWMMRAAYAEMVAVERLADLSAPMLTMDDLFELQRLDEEEQASERYRQKALAATRSAQTAVAAAPGQM